MADGGTSEISVIGAGAWGTAIANLLAGAGHRVSLWVYEKELALEMARDRVNSMYLPGFPVHDNVLPTSSYAEAAAGRRIFVSVVPSHTVRTVWKELAQHIADDALIVSATKGIDADTLTTMSTILEETIPAPMQATVATLSGPSFANEVSRNMPTTVVAAAAERAAAETIRDLFSTPRFRVYSSTDVLGVELGGALKNVIAIAAGACDGLGLGYNSRAGLITRGLAEMTHLGVAMGAKAQTFAGLSGMGDLVLTCTGHLSRNYTLGVQLGEGRALEEVMAERHTVAEGVTTAGSAVRLARKFGVEMPIAETVDAVLRGEMTPVDAVRSLMTRALKHEDNLEG